jgi:hypothetical protein
MGNSRVCAIPECRNSARAALLCGKHYQRMRKHGDPLHVKFDRSKDGDAQDFYQNVVLEYEGDDCLIWPYSTSGRGYGQLYVNGIKRLVHRLVCAEVTGPPPTLKHQAAHECGKGTSGCVTKRHLFWKTSKENSADRITHGTQSRGERTGTSKLTEGQVKEIVSLKGKELQREVAKRFKVSRGNISKIQNKTTWVWL